MATVSNTLAAKTPTAQDNSSEGLGFRMRMALGIVALGYALAISIGGASSEARKVGGRQLVEQAPDTQSVIPSCDDWAWWQARFQSCNR